MDVGRYASVGRYAPLPVTRVRDRQYKHANTNALWKIWQWKWYHKIRRTLRINSFKRYIKIFRKKGDDFEATRTQSLKERFYDLEQISEKLQRIEQLQKLYKIVNSMGDATKHMKKKINEDDPDEEFKKLNKYIISIAKRYREAAVQLCKSVIILYKVANDDETVTKILDEINGVKSDESNDGSDDDENTDDGNTDDDSD